MINLNEIRPGNWVHHKAEWSCRQTRIEEDWKEFDFQWTRDDWWRLGEGTIVEEVLEFIPLTPDWLRKFGFEQNSDVASREYLNDKWLAVDHYEKGCLVKRAGVYGVVLKYVHQLQNLYYCHEQKELEVMSLDLSKALINGN